MSAMHLYQILKLKLKLMQTIKFYSRNRRASEYMRERVLRG